MSATVIIHTAGNRTVEGSSLPIILFNDLVSLYELADGQETPPIDVPIDDAYVLATIIAGASNVYAHAGDTGFTFGTPTNSTAINAVRVNIGMPETIAVRNGQVIKVKEIA